MAVQTKQPVTKESTNQEFFGDFWNENMIEYLSKSAGGRWFKYLLGIMLEKIEPREVKTVADVGCGVGMKTVQMAEYFKDASVLGSDFAVPAIEAARKAHKLKNISFSAEDITQANYRNKYDLITAFDVLEHIKDWQDLVKKIVKVNNKYIMFSFPVGRMRPYEVNIGHYRNFKKGEVEEFMTSIGYRTVRTIYAGFPFFSPILRDLTNIFFKNYAETPQAKMSKAAKLFHDTWYFLFRYLSSKKKGDVFIGLFEKIENK